MTSRSDLIHRTGATYRRLDWWVRQGFLFPVRGEGEDGSGYERRWPELELEVAALMTRLTAAGFCTAAAAQIAREVVVPVAYAGQPIAAIVAPGIRVVIERVAADLVVLGTGETEN